MKQRTFNFTILLCTIFSTVSVGAIAQAYSDRAYNSILKGISNKGMNKEKPYVTAGDQSYIIGTMNGDFPDIGGHVPGEMGGIWMHPIKLMDGYYLKVTDLASRNQHWLSDAKVFVNYPYGNVFKYDSGIPALAVTRMQFCPDGQPGAVIQYEIINSGDETKDLSVEFLAKTDLTPVWFSKEIGVHDYSDHAVWNKKENCFLASDSLNNWHTAWGSSLESSGQSIGVNNSKSKSLGLGIACSATYHLLVGAHATRKIIFVVAGSTKGQNQAIETYRFILHHYQESLNKKIALYNAIYNRAKIAIPDTALSRVYDWVKVNTQWLVRDVPGVGRGLGAGFMEYPWWFGCDNAYALQAVMETGDFKLVEQTLRLLKNKSEEKNGNGRIPHEISTNGAVANPGNTQETAAFIMCVEKLYRWNGDKQFLGEMYPTIKKGIHWLTTDMDKNHDLFPEGYGIMEVAGLNAELIDVAVYTQQALVACSKIADVLNDPAESQKCAALAKELKAKINRDFWDDKSKSYCDFFGTKAQALTAIEGSISQLNLDKHQYNSQRIDYYEKLRNDVLKSPDTSRGWMINKNWVINTPMETAIASRTQALSALENIRLHNTGAYGPYLSAVEAKHMMTIATGVQAVAEYKYGRTAQSLEYVNKIVSTFNKVLPGSISEMMPDYGCFTQAWTNYGIVLPIISHVFGINPDASQKRIEIAPNIPGTWSTGKLSLSALPIGDNEISISYESLSGGKKYTIVLKKAGWRMVFRPKAERRVRYLVNGKPVNPTSAGQILLTSRINNIIVQTTNR